MATDRPGAAAEELAGLENATRSLSAQVREAILGLRTSVGPDGPLGQAIEEYTAEFGIQSGLRTSFSGPVTAGGSLATAARYQVMRIAQEAMSNARRHAGRRRLPSRSMSETASSSCPCRMTARGSTRWRWPARGGSVSPRWPSARAPWAEPSTSGRRSVKERRSSCRYRPARRWPTMRVLLADDHALFREGLVSLLRTRDIEVVGQASDGAEALALARALTPDVILMDLTMPGMGGLEATARSRQSSPTSRS